MKAVFAQVCAVGNSWVSHASGSYTGFQLLQFTTFSFGLRIDVGTFPLTAQKENINPSCDTVPFFTLFNFFQWHAIALVCLFREEESSAFLVSRAGIVCDTWVEEGRKKWNVWNCLPVLTWRDFPWSEKVHTHNVHSSSMFTVWRLSSGVPVHTSWVMCHLSAWNWV